MSDEHEASPECWCGPREESDGVWVHNSLILPDLGQHLWDASPAARDVLLCLVGCVPRMSISSPDGGWDLSFILKTDDGRFLGTVHTQQPRNEILAVCAASPGGIVVEGRLSADTVVGASGEQFRMILGTIDEGFDE